MSSYYGFDSEGNEFHDDFLISDNSEFLDSDDGGRKNRRHKKSGGNRWMAKTAKKAGAIALSAVLFGGVSAGAFHAVNRLTGYTAESQASAENASKSSLLKASNVSSNGAEAAGSLDVSSIAEEAMPSIVAITNKSVQEVENFFSQFGYGYQQPQTTETESRGSGIIIGKNDTELLIVSNNHVVTGADALSVSFIDNEVYEANIKGTDPDNDLAVIAVSLEKISRETMSKIAVAAIGDSDALKVGEQVVAIGNALGYGQSVTTGIVSAVNRTISSESQTDSETQSATFIQTDAAINPGNSGGALLNMKGEVIGINSAKLSSTEIEGMGYAIPTSRASDIIENLMNQTTRSKVDQAEQGSIGIKGLDVTAEVQEAYKIPQGVYVSEVTTDGAAANAGIKSGSILTSFDGKSVSGVSALQSILTYYKAGESVEVVLQVPGDGAYEEETVTLTLGTSSSSASS